MSRLRSRPLLLLASASIFTLATPSRAEPTCRVLDGGLGGPLPGTVSAELIESVVVTNARLYGAAAMAERQVLPLLAFREGGFVRYELGSTLGVLRTPVCVDDHVEMAKADISGGGFSFAYRTGPLGLYFVGTGGILSMGNDFGARLGSTFYGAGVSIASPAAFFVRRWDDEGTGTTVTLDAIAGAMLATDYGTFNLGYVASQGIYTNITAAKVHAFAAAVIQPRKAALQDELERTATTLLDEVPYLRLGFVTLDWLVGEAKETIGTTSLFARRLRYTSLPDKGPSASNVAEGAEQQLKESATAFATAHLEQFGIAKLFDVSIAGAWKPYPFLHEASIAYRIGNPLPQDVVMAKAADQGVGTLEEAWGIRFLAGVVRMPARWQYGVAGGYRFRAGVDVSLPVGVGNFTARMGFNSPETLTLYPYSVNAADVYLAGSYTM